MFRIFQHMPMRHFLYMGQHILDYICAFEARKWAEITSVSWKAIPKIYNMCEGIEFDVPSILVLVFSAASLSPFGLSSLDSILSISRES